MSKLSTKDEVDEYVKKLLSVSKNEDDVDIQCFRVAKLYFQVSEYSVAKDYIEKYLKLKSNSECGLIVKAEIHKKLKENMSALQCYETLYNISRKNKYLVEIGDILLKCDIEENVGKMWIDILETEDPHSDLLASVKLKFYADFKVQCQELEKLQNKMDKDTTNIFKRQYLSILDKVDNINFVIEKCVHFMEHYHVLDDLDLVLICRRIFKKASNLVQDDTHIQLHCVLLVSLIKNGINSDKVPYSQCLVELYDLLRLERNDEVYAELRAQFLYSLVSYAHWCAVNSGQLSHHICQYLYQGYVTLCSIETFIYNTEELHSKYLDWLSLQSLMRTSIAHHMVYSAAESLRDNKSPSNDWVDKILSFSKVTIFRNNKYFEEMIEKHVTFIPCSIETIIECDVNCFSSDFCEFGLIIWKVLCHLNLFQGNDRYPLLITSSVSVFIIELLKKLFPTLPLRTPHNRCPENISLVDVITFLLAASFTYRKLIINKVDIFPIPFLSLKVFFDSNNAIEKWWSSACDFLLNHKRNTSIGVWRECLKNGLEIVQCVGTRLPQCVALQLGHCLSNFAKENNSVNEACVERSVYFHMNAIHSARLTSRGRKWLEESSTSNKPSHFGSALNIQKNDILFDFECVSDKIMNTMRFDALLFCIEWQLKSFDFSTDLNLVDELINDAENIKICSPHLHLLKSKVHLARAIVLSKEEDSDNVRFQYFLTLASKYVEKCGQNIHSLTTVEQNELRVLLQQQRLALTNFNEQLHSLSCDSSPDLQFIPNNSQSCHFQPQFANSAPNFTTSNDQNNEMIKLLEHRLQLMSKSKEKINNDVKSCILKCVDIKNVTENDHSAIESLKHQSKVHGDIYSSQMIKMEHMTRRLDKVLMIEDEYNHLKVENKIIKEQLKNLLDVVQRLEQKNMKLEVEIDALRRSPKIMMSTIDKIIKPQLTSFNQMVDSKLTNVDQIVQNQLKTLEKMEKFIRTGNFKKKEESPLSKRESVTNANEIIKNKENKDNENEDIDSYIKDNDDCDLFSNNESKECYRETDFNSAHDDDNARTCHMCNTYVDDNMSLCRACHLSRTKNREKNVSVEVSKKSFDSMLNVEENYVWNSEKDMDFNLGTTLNNSYSYRETEFNSAHDDDNARTCHMCNKYVDENMSLCRACHLSRNKNREKKVSVEVSKKSFDSTLNAEKNDIWNSEKDMDFNLGTTLNNSYFLGYESHQVNVCEGNYSDSSLDSNIKGRVYSRGFNSEELSDNSERLTLTKERKKEVNKSYPSNLTENELRKGTKERVDEDDEEMQETNESPFEEEDWECMFNKECAFYENYNKDGIMHKTAEVKILVQQDIDDLSLRLLMETKEDNVVCYNRVISRGSPKFLQMTTKKTTVHWYENNQRKEHFALKFKSEEELKKFLTIITKLQSNCSMG